MSDRKLNRRRRTASEKLRIVLAALDPAVEISQLCRREGLNPTQYYAWRKQLLSSAERVFSENGQRPSRQQASGVGAVAGEGRDRGDHGGE